MFQMELTAPECRHFAEECRRLANTAKTIEERIYLREREAVWIQLAEDAERASMRRAQDAGLSSA